MSHWLIPANIKYYDVIGAFSEPIVYWSINSTISVGDTVYIYLAAPFKQISYVCIVLEIDIEQSQIIENLQPYFKDSQQTTPSSKQFMKLQISENLKFDTNSLISFQNLKNNGLKGMIMGPRKLENNPLLLNYIKQEIQ